MPLLPLLAALVTLGASPQPPLPPTQVRVAIVAYEDFHREYEQFGQLFSKTTQRDPTLHFRLAVGSYGDVCFAVISSSPAPAWIRPAENSHPISISSLPLTLKQTRLAVAARTLLA